MLSATAVAETTPLHTGAPVEGSSRWWPPGHARAWIEDVATAPRVSVTEPARLVAEGMGDEDLLLDDPADADVPAAVDRPPARRDEDPGDEVGDMALAGAAEVEPQARGSRDDASPRPRSRRQRARRARGRAAARDAPGAANRAARARRGASDSR